MREKMYDKFKANGHDGYLEKEWKRINVFQKKRENMIDKKIGKEKV